MSLDCPSTWLNPIWNAFSPAVATSSLHEFCATTSQVCTSFLLQNISVLCLSLGVLLLFYVSFFLNLKGSLKVLVSSVSIRELKLNAPFKSWTERFQRAPLNQLQSSLQIILVTMPKPFLLWPLIWLLRLPEEPLGALYTLREGSGKQKMSARVSARADRNINKTQLESLRRVSKLRGNEPTIWDTTHHFLLYGLFILIFWFAFNVAWIFTN